VLQDLAHSSSTGLDASPLSVDYRYILEQAPATSVRIAVPLSRLLDLNRPENQQFILGQAAEFLNLPLPVLLELSGRQHHLHKRPRLTSSPPMSTPYADNPSLQDGREKSPLVGPPGRVNSTARKPFAAFPDGFSSSGWTGARIADCLANFTMCPPCSTYEPSGMASRMTPLKRRRAMR
jgi:hypothetical protein